METALVFGTGPGLGRAIARRFAAEEMAVGIAARDASRLDDLLPELRATGAPAAHAYACDVGAPQFVADTFRRALDDLGIPRVVVFNAGAFVREGLLETSADDFEHCWRTGCMGGFLVGQQSVQAMLEATPRADGALGTIIFTGATASLRGGARFHNLAVGKFGLRALAQSMAREFQGQGIHVAHTVIDGQIRSATDDAGDTRLDPDAIAESYWQLHAQQRSAWTQELDLRPWSESF